MKELLVNTLFGLFPIALFVLAIFFGLQRFKVEISQSIARLKRKEKECKKKADVQFKEMHKKNDEAQIIEKQLIKESNDIEEHFLNVAKKEAQIQEIQKRINNSQKRIKQLKFLEEETIAEISAKKKITIEWVVRNSPFKNSAAIFLLTTACVILGACDHDPDPKFTYEINAFDITGSYKNENSESTIQLYNIPDQEKVSIDKHKFTLTTINDRRLQNSYTDSIDYALPYSERVDKERIKEQFLYSQRIHKGSEQFLSEAEKNLGQSYIFGAIKSCCNKLAKSGADIKILHLYTDLLPSEPACEIALYTKNPKLIFESKTAEGILQRVDDYYYENPYEDWSGIKIIVHYMPNKQKDELFAASMELMKIWIGMHGGKIVRGS